jgi:hypothetical protein
MPVRARKLIAAALVSAAAICLAANPNTDYVTPSFTFSPNGRYGVMVPVWHDEGAQEPDERQNKVVELSTGRVVTVIHADPGYNRALNHHETAPPHWSADSSVLLWKVNGKWFPDALVLLKLNDGREQWQIDLMKISQRAILTRTKNASPQRYAAAKQANSGNGSAYPEGFTVNVATDDKIAFPYHVLVDLTANPKQNPGFPADLDSHLDAIVTSDGKFTVKDFHVIWPASQREIAQRLIGEWEGVVHTRAFYEGGAFALDPQAGEKPNGTWELKGANSPRSPLMSRARLSSVS